MIKLLLDSTVFFNFFGLLLFFFLLLLLSCQWKQIFSNKTKGKKIIEPSSVSGARSQGAAVLQGLKDPDGVCGGRHIILFLKTPPCNSLVT